MKSEPAGCGRAALSNVAPAKEVSSMPLDADLLQRFARKYVWWKKPEEAVARPDRIVAQVMNIGDYDDVQSLVHQADLTYLREVLVQAEAGQFDARSWTYWHYRLGLSNPGEVPELPRRRLG